jgi:RNA polymerase sigma-70 factor (ECF subfamily)
MSTYNDMILEHRQHLRKLAFTLTRSPHDADDLVQDTMVKAYKAFDRYDGRYPKAWLSTIMKNTARNNWAKKAPVLPGDDAFAIIAVGSNVYDLEEQQLSERMAAAMATLPPERREVLWLVDVLSWPYKDVAAVQGVAVGTVAGRLSRGRKQIREALGEA